MHDDVIKWKHFPRYWPFVRGIHRSPVNSPHKGQWGGALMFSLICARINGWINNGEAGDLRRHRDVTVMVWLLAFGFQIPYPRICAWTTTMATIHTTIKLKHFPRYWPFVRGIHGWPVDSPHKVQSRGALMFSLICVWTNSWANNGDAGDLRRHRAHYDVIVMDQDEETTKCGDKRLASETRSRALLKITHLHFNSPFNLACSTKVYCLWPYWQIICTSLSYQFDEQPSTTHLNQLRMVEIKDIFMCRYGTTC